MAWFNAGLSNNSGGASSFNDLDDVSINTQTLSNGQVPVYNSTTHKWENGEQSGGSSGHTIINDGGTSLTQRDNLQFKGAYSEDNSTNGKTVVNVVRSMTKAQFDQLTNNEKAGFINITDITGGNDDRFQPVIYSEEEREIGVWVDGKPLYEKTIINSNPSYTQVGSIYECNTSVDFSGVDYFMIVNATALNANTTRPVNNTRTDITAMGYVAVGKSTNVIYTAFNTDGYTKLVFTLRYTKTTDTPGSGQWTPQGVPAHHYSTNEQIVGTWIDGSTVYEKTIISTSELSKDSINQIALGITNIDIFVSVIGFASYGSNNTYIPLPYGDKGNSLICLMNINKALGVANVWVGSDYTSPSIANILIITLRYTKSST